MPTTAQPVADRPLFGIACALASGAVFSISDAASKWLTLEVPALEVTWVRWCGFLLAVLPVVLWSRGRVLRSAAPKLQVARSACLIGSTSLFIAGLSHLPLASAVAINFVAPLFVTALSIPLLGEIVGIRRWAAVAVGLVGVLIVVRPGSGTFGWAAGFPIAAAGCWACAVIATRRLGGIDGPWTSMTYTAVIGWVVLSLAVPFDFRMLDGRQLAVATLMAVASTLGQFLMLAAYRNAPASLAAPFVYATLIWSTGFGYALFGNIPDGPTWIGAGIITASGVYTAWRERVRAREAALAAAG